MTLFGEMLKFYVSFDEIRLVLSKQNVQWEEKLTFKHKQDAFERNGVVTVATSVGEN